MRSHRIDDDGSWRLISNDPTIDQQNHYISINPSQIHPPGNLSGEHASPSMHVREIHWSSGDRDSKEIVMVERRSRHMKKRGNSRESENGTGPRTMYRTQIVSVPDLVLGVQVARRSSRILRWIPRRGISGKSRNQLQGGEGQSAGKSGGSPVGSDDVR
jgi:hypothetical protein